MSELNWQEAGVCRQSGTGYEPTIHKAPASYSYVDILSIGSVLRQQIKQAAIMFPELDDFDRKRNSMLNMYKQDMSDSITYRAMKDTIDKYFTCLIDFVSTYNFEYAQTIREIRLELIVHSTQELEW